MEHEEPGNSDPCIHNYNSLQISDHLHAGVTRFLIISVTQAWMRCLIPHYPAILDKCVKRARINFPAKVLQGYLQSSASEISMTSGNYL